MGEAGTREGIFLVSIQWSSVDRPKGLVIRHSVHADLECARETSRILNEHPECMARQVRASGLEPCFQVARVSICHYWCDAKGFGVCHCVNGGHVCRCCGGQVDGDGKCLN